MLKERKLKKQTRNKWLRKLMRAHIFITVLFLGVYFSVAFFDPGFLSYDLRHKFQALADEWIYSEETMLSVFATVLDPPVKPIVTGEAVCSNGALSINLDWPSDINSESYDITRDGAPLISDLIASQHTDAVGLVVNTSYTYIVTAYGPMGPGSAESDPVILTTPEGCGETLPAAMVQITSFDGKSIASFTGIPTSTDRRSIFSGTSNIPNATIRIVIGSPSNFMAELTANANGYFAWQPPANLSFGTQTFTVTAIDPNDSLRQASDSLQFKIKEKVEDTAVTTPPPAETPVIQPEESTLLDFSLSVKNRDKKIFQGETLNVSLLIKDIALQYQNTNIPVRFSIVDSNGNIILSLTTEELLRKGMEIQKLPDTPAYIAPGKYFLQAEVLLGKTNVSRLDEFTVVEAPLFDLSGNVSITYAGIVRNLGWITLTLLILLLLWLLMFIREYGMYLQAIRHITEEHLRKAGFITKRRGVIQ